MKKFFLPLLCMLIITSCKKENFCDTNGVDLSRHNFKNKLLPVKICHKDTYEKWVTININFMAMAAHLAHADVLPDADGDGYTKLNPCGIGSQNDCDDNDAAIHPAAVEICGNITDDNCNGVIDENCFPSVTVCNQLWMQYNLAVDNYRDGTPIPQATTEAEWIAASINGTGAWCYYENNTSYGVTYGKLYNWFAVNDSRGLAPTGWHVPSNTEWHILVKCIEPTADTSINNYAQKALAGGALKETGTIHWAFPNGGATNTSAFTALPGGNRNGLGRFFSLGSFGNWWTASQSEYSTTSAWNRYLNYSDNNIYWGFASKAFGFSVRCLKD
jgi:uncharacterized protein (TIGR02145 family)